MGKKQSEFSKLLQKHKLPNVDWQTLIGPVFKAIKELGGSAQNEEIVNKVIEILNLPDDVVDCIHAGKAGGNELTYRIGWAKTAMKEYAVLDNSTRGVWSITEEYSSISQIDDIAPTIAENHKNCSLPASQKTIEEEVTKEPWREELLEVLKNMNPYGFERLAQRILRESGFTDVVVTKKSGDGGIDGRAKFIVEGFLSFNVAFQCKRFAGAVGAPMIRDFRGSLTADIEKGLFITTGSFTAEAKKEAYIAGKQNIDLIDGEILLDKIIALGLGVHEKTIYEVDKEFFDKI